MFSTAYSTQKSQQGVVHFVERSKPANGFREYRLAFFMISYFLLESEFGSVLLPFSTTFPTFHS